MNRQNMLTAFLALTLVVWVAVLIIVGLLALERGRPGNVLPTPVVVGPQALTPAAPIWTPTPTLVPPPAATPIPGAVPPGGPLVEHQLALGFDLSAIRPETVRAKIFEPVIGRPPSATFVQCPQSLYEWQCREPGMCYDALTGNFIVAGFQPNETVRIVRYVEGLFAGTADLRLDDYGRGLLTEGSPHTDIFVIRENGAYISSDPALGSPYTL